MEKMLGTVLNTEIEEDYYSIIGCAPSASTEQILCEYRQRARMMHPDKNTQDPLANDKFQTLQHVKSVLCDEQRRRDYDRWRNSGLHINYQQWCKMQLQQAGTSLHWAKPQMTGHMLTPGHHVTSATDTEEKNSIKSDSGELGSHSGRAHVTCYQAGHSRWRRGQKSSELLEKFRNYEI